MVERVDREIAVGPNRRVALAASVFFGLMIAVGVSRAAATSNTESAVLILIVLGIPFLVFAYKVIQRGPSLVFNDECINNIRSHKAVTWEKIGDLCLIQERGVFGEYHFLHFTDRSTQNAMTLSLDQLSIGWKEIVEIVESRVGREVPVRREAGIRIRRRTA